MSGAVVRLPTKVPPIMCDFCVGSPVNRAERNLAIELEGGGDMLKGRVLKFEVHVCRPCRLELFKPSRPAALRFLDDQLTYGLVRGMFTFLPATRVQRKRR